jgi:prepilin-type N-terminal cleavage/methylation domain-containing protein
MRMVAGMAGRVVGARGRLCGVTLVELMVALAVSAMIILGTATVMRHVVMAAGEQRNDTMAVVEVQVSGFWINEDVVQAQSIRLGDPGGIGFPLTVEWTDWDGDRNRVTYGVQGMVDELGRSLWQLVRTQEKDTGSGYESMGSAFVGEYLDPGATSCSWKSGTEDILVLEVTALVDQSEASSTYEMNPRALKQRA